MPAAPNVSAQALSMAQYALMSNEPLVRAITFSLIDNGSVMARDIPFVNKASLYANGVRWIGNLPTVDWVALNTEGSTITGTPTPYQEQAYQIRNNIDVDKRYVQDVNQLIDPRQALLQAFIKSWAYDFNDKFINNNHATGDPDSIVGLRFRLDNPTLYQIPTANKIDCTGATADMSQSGMTADTLKIFHEFIEQLLWSTNSPDGEGVVFYMNEIMKRRWETGLRRFAGVGGFATAQDQVGRTVLKYKAATIQDVGYKQDQSTRIITSTETAAGVNGSSTFTSLYAVNYGTDSLFGWQFEPLQVMDIGLTEGGAIYRTAVDWMGGIYQQGHRAVARLYNIKIS